MGKLCLPIYAKLPPELQSAYNSAMQLVGIT